jgi:hypothetical protein
VLSGCGDQITQESNSVKAETGLKGEKRRLTEGEALSTPMGFDGLLFDGGGGRSPVATLSNRVGSEHDEKERKELT